MFGFIVLEFLQTISGASRGIGPVGNDGQIAKIKSPNLKSLRCSLEHVEKTFEFQHFHGTNNIKIDDVAKRAR